MYQARKIDEIIYKSIKQFIEEVEYGEIKIILTGAYGPIDIHTTKKKSTSPTSGEKKAYEQETKFREG